MLFPANSHYSSPQLSSAPLSRASGFAFGLVAASICLYVLTPLQTTTLIVAFGLIVQGYSVWKLRHAAKSSSFAC
jgi:hypothetical protein